MLLALLLLLASPPADRPRLPPVDKCAVAPGFAAFREELLGVIARRDVKQLLALSDENIMLSFGGHFGHEAMRKMWQLDRPAASTIWAELGEALSLGCALTDGGAVAPSMAHNFPADFDVFEVMIAVKPAALRAAPSDSARAIGTLDWDLLTIEDWDPDRRWTKVRLQDGRTGFVRTDAVRSPIDYRAIFERKGGKWRMTAFVAGD